MKQVKLHSKTDELLTALSKKRKLDGELTSTKQGIVAQLVLLAHKKECK